jgi:hypothetical protein
VLPRSPPITAQFAPAPSSSSAPLGDAELFNAAAHPCHFEARREGEGRGAGGCASPAGHPRQQQHERCQDGSRE